MVRDINMGTMVTINASVLQSGTAALTVGIRKKSVIGDRTDKCYNTEKNKESKTYLFV
jgi:hypothetical protein